MRDITELLSSAAPQTITDLDLTQVAERGAALRRRQRMARSAAATSFALAAVFLFRDLGPGTQALELTPAEPAPRATATVLPAPTRAPANVSPLVGTRPSAALAPGRTSTAEGAPPALGGRRDPAPTPQAAPPTTTPTGNYSPARSCSVSTTALTPDQSATCRFAATAPGGIQLSFSAVVLPKGKPMAHVDVVRNGRTTRYDPWAPDNRCRLRVIEVGDLVTVTVQQMPAGSYLDYTLTAGADRTCRERTAT